MAKTKKVIWYCATCQHKRREEKSLPIAVLCGVEWGGCGKEENGRICGTTEIEVEE